LAEGEMVSVEKHSTAGLSGFIISD
jgi:hypothetical protein